MDRLRDRGNKKWTSIMLPEHVKMLKELFVEQDHIKRPLLDEQQIMENDAILQGALRDDRKVKITYYTNNKLQTIIGKILFIDTLGGVLRLEETEILWTNIVEVIMFD